MLETATHPVSSAIAAVRWPAEPPEILKQF